MSTIVDHLETLIIMSLDANEATRALSQKAKRGSEIAKVIDQGTLLPIGEMLADSAFTFDATDKDRVFTKHPNLLMAHPAEILGSQAEIVMFCDSIMKWIGFREIKRAPKGVSVFGRASHWYEVHYRISDICGRSEYYKRVVPLSKSGLGLPAQIGGHWVCNPYIEGVMPTIAASVIEDATRPGSMLATARDATAIKFPVPVRDYKKAFFEREEPTVNGRRKPILHWVSGHIRQSNTQHPITVNAHTRGIQEFLIDDLSITIEVNSCAAGVSA